MARTHITRLGVNAPAGSVGPRIIPLNPDGFPRDGLVNSFRFAEADLTLGNKDSVTGVHYGIAGAGFGSGSATMESGGGLTLAGTRWLAGPLFNITLPWTIATTLKRAHPASTATSPRGVLLAGQPDANGFELWLQSIGSEDITANALHGLYNRRFTTVETNGTPIPLPWVARFDHPQCVFITHDGSGNIAIYQTHAGSVQLIGQTWNMTQIQGSAGLPNLQMKMGAQYAAFVNDQATHDAFDCYNYAFDLPAVQAWTAAGEALAASRGRS